LSNVDYLPYPEQLYLEVCGLIFKDKEERPSTRTVSSRRREARVMPAGDGRQSATRWTATRAHSGFA
jgi:hypothetical protein